MDDDNRIKVAEYLAEKIESDPLAIIRLLDKYESHATIQDEIERSLSALRGARNEYNSTHIPYDSLRIAAFFPLNLPLYSLILFAVIPSVVAQSVYVRAPGIMQEILTQLAQLLEIEDLFPNIKIRNVSRAIFTQVYANTSDVILFTGQYENALNVRRQCPDSLFIFNGGGTNPAIVFGNGDVALAAKKLAEMRTFNSGQDCAGTDVIFVDESIKDTFISNLNQELDRLKVGSYADSATDIGPILKKEYVDTVSDFINAHSEHITRSGIIDRENSIVSPYVITQPIENHTGEFHEFFAPVFYILTFKDEEKLLAMLELPEISDYSMYISYFGDSPIMNAVRYAVPLKDVIINDVEQGNLPYGGYGSKANFVAFGQKITPGPILISKELNKFFTRDDLQLEY